MEETDDAYQALDNLNNAEFFGRVLKINYAKPESVSKSKAGTHHHILANRELCPCRRNVVIVKTRCAFARVNNQRIMY